jgi:hypothetical protein
MFSPRNKEIVSSTGKKTILKMENDNGVKYVWIDVLYIAPQYI